MPIRVFSLQCLFGTDVSCCNGVRLDVRSLALLEHVLVRRTAFSHDGIGVPKCRRRQRPSPTSSLPRVNWSVAGRRARRPSKRPARSRRATPTRGARPTRASPSWASSAWPLPEELGGAGGTVDDLCAMVDEAAAAMVPGPIATTAVATLVIPGSRAELLEALASGERTAGLALAADVKLDEGKASGTAEYVLGRRRKRCSPAARRRCFRSRRRRSRRGDRRAADADRLLPPAGPRRAGWCRGRSASGLQATRRGPRRDGAGRRGCGGGAMDAARPQPSTRRCASSSASRSAASRPSSTCAPRCCCAPNRSRWPQAMPPARSNGSDDPQLSIAAAVAAAVGIEMTKANAKDCIQVLGGIGITWEHDAHLYLRRAYGDRAVPRRPVALAAPRRRVDPAGCAPRTAHRPGIRGTPATRDRRDGRRYRRPARREAPGRARRGGPAWRRTGRSRTAGRHRPPSSC